jgi:hypothetical protein
VYGTEVSSGNLFIGAPGYAGRPTDYPAHLLTRFLRLVARIQAETRS